MDIGEKIKKLRVEKGISQTDLAIKIDVSKQTLYKYENGIISNIPSDKVELLSKALNTSPAYLMGWSENIVPEDYQEAYMEAIRALASDTQKSQLLKYFDNLNEEGKRELVKYARLLHNSGDYKQTSSSEDVG